MVTFKKVNVLEGIAAMERQKVSPYKITRTKTGLRRGRLVLSHRWNARGAGHRSRVWWSFRENSSGHILIGRQTRVLGAEIRHFGPDETDYIVIFSVY